MKGPLKHEMIRASAGSGKTYQLVLRYIRLLATGVDPRRIIALTFTRKAAGEFLQNIFLRLTKAAGDPEEAARLSGEIQAGEGTTAFFQGLLSGLVREIGNLQLGTIDRFFARLVGAFPYELGLTRPHRIMDDFERNVARQQAMERLLAGGDPEREKDILQLYKQLTWGTEEKNVYGLFEEKLKAFHDLFLENRDARAWGDGQRIFRQPPWWAGKPVEIDKLIPEIERELAVLKPGKAMSGAFARILDTLAVWQPGMPFEGGTLWERLLEAHDELQSGQAVLEYSRSTLEIGPPLSGLLFDLVRHYMSREIARQLVTTQSIGTLLDGFDRLYEQSVREAGSLVFADLPMLLIRGLCAEAPLLDGGEIVYRLDGQLDHWLIDEFQDTSRIQWKVLHAFLDEVLQDASGERSFFYVGDVKQSIYGWRGGDARLFEEIYDHYKDGQPGIKASSLARSWRSAPPVLDCVNALFGEGISASLLGERVSQRWKQQWSAHEPSEPTSRLPGYAAWGEVEDEEAMQEACAGLVRAVDPLSRGMSCAILMRKNDQITAMTQALREKGIPTSMEGTVRIARDNVVGTWILAFLYSMARPDEAFPRDFLRLPNLGMEEDDYRRLAGLVRGVLAEDGYPEAMRRLLERLESLIGPNAFLRRRREQLLEAATRFSGANQNSLEHFIAYLESSTVEESTLHSQVQVMTVHKAKGLDFDMVIVAGFGKATVLQAKNRTLHVQRLPDGEIEWILDLPRKQVLGQDPTLSEADTRQREDSLFEALCLLYVAMTRARQGLYCVAPSSTGGGRQLTWDGLLKHALGRDGDGRIEGTVTWNREWGDAQWYASSKPETLPPARPVRLDALRGTLPERRPAFKRMASPSEAAHEAGLQRRPLRGTGGRQFGTRMHDFLSTVEWVDLNDPAAVQGILARADTDLRERVRLLLHGQPGREVFGRPESPVRLWREKPYILRREDAVSQGIIDRAILRLDEEGSPLAVCIYDFKTDALDPGRDAQEQLLERYGLQLDRYIEAAVALTGLPREKITTKLVPV